LLGVTAGAGVGVALGVGDSLGVALSDGAGESVATGVSLGAGDSVTVGESLGLGDTVATGESLGLGAGSVGAAPKTEAPDPATMTRLRNMDAPRRLTRDGAMCPSSSPGGGIHNPYAHFPVYRQIRAYVTGNAWWRTGPPTPKSLVPMG
jgi:hypothetical protein